MPRRSLVIHLDDGHRGNVALAPLLSGLEARPTLFLCPDRLGDPRTMSLEQARRLGESVELGSHSRTHPSLPCCDRDRAVEEIAGSQLELERLLEQPCRDFAYPRGAYGEREVELVRAAGYRSARSVDIGWIGPGADRFRLPLLSIDPTSTSRLAAELSGFKWLSRIVNREGRINGRRRFDAGGAGPKPGRSI